MKIELIQINYHIANFDKNTTAIIEAIEKAKNEGVDLAVFSELSVCGYPPYDLLEQKDFIQNCERSVEKIAASCQGIAAIVGGPSLNPNPSGKKLYNTAYFLEEGAIRQIVHKTLLPTYDIFDEYRYFEPNNDFKIINYKGRKIALTICEDLWDDQPVFTSFGRSHLYTVSPMERLEPFHPDMIINIAASPFAYTQVDIRRHILIRNAKKYHIPVFYVNQVGAQTELIFDGGSTVVDARGKIVGELNLFEEDRRIFESENLTLNPAIPAEGTQYKTIELIYKALILGIRDYFNKMNFKTAILGLSGGIDSALTLVLAAQALGTDKTRVILMPSKYSSDHSVNDAVRLAENLKVHYDIISIKSMVESFESSLHPVFKDLPPDITEENIQARIRGTLLMALSNKFGNILLNTSNKSEAAVGYGTLYGDMSGGLSVLGDVYKTQVYELSRFINREEEIIPVNTIIKPPSAELRPDQKDSDSLPEYDILDKILFHYIELQESVEEITKLGIDAALVKKVMQMVNRNEYKRYQSPPILRISSKAFGIGRRMPLVARY